MRFVAEGRRHHALRGMVPALVLIFALIEQEVLDQGLAKDALAAGSRPRDRLMRLTAAGMHDVKWRAGHVGDHDGAVGGLALDFRRARIGMALGATDAALEQGFLHAGDDVAVLGVHQGHGAEMGAARKRVIELVVIDHQRALVGHKMLEGVDAVGLDDDLHLVEHLFRPRGHRHVEAVVARRFLGFVPPLLIRRQHRLPGIGKAEIDHHGGAAGQRRLGAPFEIVGGDGTHERHFEMGMRTGVDHFCARGRVDCGADRDNGLVVDQDIGRVRMIVIHDRAAADDKSSHGISEQYLIRSD